MKIVTWNVNSIRARLEIFIEWMAENQPEVMLLQEIKCEEHAFPLEAIEDLGYNIAIFGQKTFNGVAILSKYPLDDIQRGIPGFGEDAQARYIEAVTNGVRVASVYVPNGQNVDTEKYIYKLGFLEKLRQHLANTLEYEEAFVIGGDYNIAPADKDVADPKAWHEEVLCSTPERKAFNTLLNLGYHDAFRIHHPEDKIYSWWDYRSQAWPKNEGLRIDHLLLSPQATDRLQITGIDSKPRGKEKASDHAPVWCLLQ